jgi:radical SAM superfamily enzyme YgiQ (UPF0313 family)
MKKPLRVMLVNPMDCKSLVETGFPHLGLGSLSAAMKRAFPGLETMIVRGHLQEWIHDWQPDILGITSVSQYWDEAKFHAQRAKQGGLPVIVGGVHATWLPETMTEDMDVLVLREGEQTIIELVRLFQAEGEFRPASLRSIPGIAFRQNGQVVRTTPRPMTPDLDSLPHIDRTILPHSYHTGMFTSRGCPYGCVFCASTRYWPKMRFHSAEYVAEEIGRLHEEGVSQITFLDDLFVADKRRVVQLISLLGRRDLLGKLSYISNVRSNLVTDDLCRLLHDMNVKVVGLGMESANPETLAYLKGEGNITVEDHARALEKLANHRIIAHPSFIIGSPQETREQIMDSYRFIREHRIPDFEVYVLMPFPGTPVWDYAAQRGLVGPDMKWERLRYTVTDFGPQSIVLSERLGYQELADLYRMFTALRVRGRRVGMVKQAIKHPTRAILHAVRLIQGNESLPEPYPPRR